MVDEVSRGNPNTYYFPSYEIITGNYTRSEYFEDDLRGVKPEGVNHVMKLFMKHCVKKDVGITSNPEIDNIVCDEEALDV